MLFLSIEKKPGRGLRSTTLRTGKNKLRGAEAIGQCLRRAMQDDVHWKWERRLEQQPASS